MFKVPEHQVAGHTAKRGELGPLVDELGRFYKPFQSKDRGSKELSFYNSFSSNVHIPNNIRKFFPHFYGVQHIEASDGSGIQPHLVLEDLISNLCHPSIMDIKIGSRTWYPQASEDYFKKCIKRDQESTTVKLGFRISGLQMFQGKELEFWKSDKKDVAGFTMEDVKLVLRKFVSINSNSNSVPDCLLASTVYGGSDGILAKLLELKSWFEDQTLFHFNSCSILMLYESDVANEGVTTAQVKLIDFAHALEGQGVIDHNFLGGLCSLIKFISEILIDSYTYEDKVCLPGSNQKNVSSV